MRTVQPKGVFGPDEAVTMDYDPDRINFVIGEDGTIADVRCG
ncbi:I78 family peptidase inhibitor [Roseicyclus salinarum]